MSGGADDETEQEPEDETAPAPPSSQQPELRTAAQQPNLPAGRAAAPRLAATGRPPLPARRPPPVDAEPPEAEMPTPEVRPGTPGSEASSLVGPLGPEQASRMAATERGALLTLGMGPVRVPSLAGEDLEDAGVGMDGGMQPGFEAWAGDDERPGEAQVEGDEDPEGPHALWTTLVGHVATRAVRLRAVSGLLQATQAKFLADGRAMLERTRQLEVELRRQEILAQLPKAYQGALNHFARKQRLTRLLERTRPDRVFGRWRPDSQSAAARRATRDITSPIRAERAAVERLVGELEGAWEGSPFKIGLLRSLLRKLREQRKCGGSSWRDTSAPRTVRQAGWDLAGTGALRGRLFLAALRHCVATGRQDEAAARRFLVERWADRCLLGHPGIPSHSAWRLIFAGTLSLALVLTQLREIFALWRNFAHRKRAGRLKMQVAQAHWAATGLSQGLVAFRWAVCRARTRRLREALAVRFDQYRLCIAMFRGWAGLARTRRSLKSGLAELLVRQGAPSRSVTFSPGRPGRRLASVHEHFGRLLGVPAGLDPAAPPPRPLAVDSPPIDALPPRDPYAASRGGVLHLLRAAYANARVLQTPARRARAMRDQRRRIRRGLCGPEEVGPRPARRAAPRRLGREEPTDEADEAPLPQGMRAWATVEEVRPALDGLPLDRDVDDDSCACWKCSIFTCACTSIALPLALDRSAEDEADGLGTEAPSPPPPSPSPAAPEGPPVGSLSPRSHRALLRRLTAGLPAVPRMYPSAPVPATATAAATGALAAGPRPATPRFRYAAQGPATLAAATPSTAPPRVRLPTRQSLPLDTLCPAEGETPRHPLFTWARTSKPRRAAAGEAQQPERLLLPVPLRVRALREQLQATVRERVAFRHRVRTAMGRLLAARAASTRTIDEALASVGSLRLARNAFVTWRKLFLRRRVMELADRYRVAAAVWPAFVRWKIESQTRHNTHERLLERFLRHRATRNILAWRGFIAERNQRAHHFARQRLLRAGWDAWAAYTRRRAVRLARSRQAELWSRRSRLSTALKGWRRWARLASLARRHSATDATRAQRRLLVHVWRAWRGRLEGHRLLRRVFGRAQEWWDYATDPERRHEQYEFMGRCFLRWRDLTRASDRLRSERSALAHAPAHHRHAFRRPCLGTPGPLAIRPVRDTHPRFRCTRERDLAADMYRHTALLRAGLRAWKLFHNTCRICAEVGARADARLLLRSFAEWRRWATDQRARLSRFATRWRRAAPQRRAFVGWRQAAYTQRQVKLLILRRAFRLWHGSTVDGRQVTPFRSALAKLKPSDHNGQYGKRVPVALACSHYRRVLLGHCLATWRAYLGRVRRAGELARLRLMCLARVTFRAWRLHTRAAIRHRRGDTIAGAHYGRALAGRILRAWRQVHGQRVARQTRAQMAVRTNQPPRVWSLGSVALEHFHEPLRDRRFSPGGTTTTGQEVHRVNSLLRRSFACWRAYHTAMRIKIARRHQADSFWLRQNGLSEGSSAAAPLAWSRPLTHYEAQTAKRPPFAGLLPTAASRPPPGAPASLRRLSRAFGLWGRYARERRIRGKLTARVSLLARRRLQPCAPVPRHLHRREPVSVASHHAEHRQPAASPARSALAVALASAPGGPPIAHGAIPGAIGGARPPGTGRAEADRAGGGSDPLVPTIEDLRLDRFLKQSREPPPTGTAPRVLLQAPRVPPPPPPEGPIFSTRALAAASDRIQREDPLSFLRPGATRSSSIASPALLHHAEASTLAAPPPLVSGTGNPPLPLHFVSIPPDLWRMAAPPAGALPPQPSLALALKAIRE
ncbi:hypothetical protein PAPYR_9950 [Paratrimastix pyriformis]|uniref:Sfi1 spindle body domain-containing protein n=1 Tax=Paratrimastix pyriformis TaxID=342808 RepID=A0ABQ8U735_9EUKA|nr:hypothetical protein PAPYR_9950 [Paratrimastix pyriformis]